MEAVLVKIYYHLILILLAGMALGLLFLFLENRKIFKFIPESTWLRLFLIMILAAFQSIPDELYEAARMDGANLWQEFRFVSWPMIFPTVLITTLLRTIWTANYVEIIQIMTEGGPGYSSLTLPIYAFRKAYSSLDFGYSSALSLVLVGILALLVWIYMRLLKNRGSLI